MEIIESSSNRTIKYVKSLQVRKNRQQNGEFVVEGLRFSKEAFESGWEISKLIVSQEFREFDKNWGIEPIIVSEKLFAEISETENPQGILVVVKFPQINEMPANAKSVVFLDCIQDPGNMGTIVRSADAFGFDAVIVSEKCVDIYNSKTLRATMGSIFHIPVYMGGSSEEIMEKLKMNGYLTYAAHLNGTPLEMTMKREKIALIIGNEANGISDIVTKKADFLVKIPMRGKAESLNASVAAGILLYEIASLNFSEN